MLSSVSNLGFEPKPLPFRLHSSSSVHSKFLCKLGHVVSFRFVIINTALSGGRISGFEVRNLCVCTHACFQCGVWNKSIGGFVFITQNGAFQMVMNILKITLCIVHISYLRSETTSAHLPLMIGTPSFRAKWWCIWVDIHGKHCVLAPYPHIAIS